MSYYDHATAMAFKLDRWADERILRNFELEALDCEQRALGLVAKKQSFFSRCMSVFRLRRSSEAANAPKDLKP